MDPLKYLLEKPVLDRRLSRWLMLLAEFNLVYITKKAVKGRVIAEHYAGLLIEGQPLDDDFPDKGIMMLEGNNMWKLFFDGASN